MLQSQNKTLSIFPYSGWKGEDRQRGVSFKYTGPILTKNLLNFIESHKIYQQMEILNTFFFPFL